MSKDGSKFTASKPIEIKPQKSAIPVDYRDRKLSGGLSMLETSSMEKYGSEARDPEIKAPEKPATETWGERLPAADYKPVTLPTKAPARSGLSMAFAALDVKEGGDKGII